MATVKISELPAILGANTVSTDVLPLVDVSANTTNKITRAEFFSNIGNMSGVGTITGATTLSLLTTTTSALTLDSGTTGAINIGTNANAKTITIGNATGASAVAINSGTGNIILNGANANNVGIGTTTPTDLVQLVGGNLLVGTDSGDPFNSQSRVRIQGAGSEYIQIKGDSTGTLGLLLGDATDNFLAGILSSQPENNLIFHAGNAERMRIDASGNLGLGVTPSAWATLVPAIQIGGGGSFIAAQGSGTVNSDSIYIGTNAHFNGTNWLYKETNHASYFLQANGQHQWFTAPSGTAGNVITFTQAMTLDASGNLGIGTTSPNASAKLTARDASNAVLRTENTVGGYALFGVTDNASSEGFVDSTNSFRFRLAGTEYMRLAAGGNLGIGNTAPVVPLHVTGDTMTTGVVYNNQPAQTSKAAAATLTIAELETGIIQYTGAAATLTLPTGTLIEGGVPASFPVNMSFDFSVINTGTGTATLGTATGLTLTGSMAVAINVSGRFRVRKTATNTYTVYRIG